uniref:Uncharacterized protein n=1 Tax=Kwoniella pini CBS 10737 TaxID=1296096 RepID=A0A1B9HY31_9TREE|nr:uncharacterized protein I206_06042 [Kwoniella pini CBS 10737]OCF48174.1 hypothetical protein I206_06042 [Kwoniella pini CBS 10737]
MVYHPSTLIPKPSKLSISPSKLNINTNMKPPEYTPISPIDGLRDKSGENLIEVLKESDTVFFNFTFLSTREALQELDDGLSEKHDLRDMIDTVPNCEQDLTAEIIVKTLAGGINRRIDGKA